MERITRGVFATASARHIVASVGVVGMSIAPIACGIGTEPVGGAPLDAVEIHAVLDPSRSMQTILVERVRPTAVSAASSTKSPFDPLDPIASEGGVPVTNAHVVLGNGRDSVVLAQTRRSDGSLTGVYVAKNVNGVDGSAVDGPAFPLVPGQHYMLEVRIDGDVGARLEGHTQIPGTPTSLLVRVNAETLDVAGGAHTFRWSRVPGARAYLLTITHPSGEFSAILSDTSTSIDGTLRDPGHGLAPVLVAGFDQSLSIVAIDSAYYDWVRIERVNSAELKTHLSGGLGVFGSALPLIARSIVTMTSDTTPPNGHWIATDSAAAAGGALPAWFDIYRGDEHAGVVRLSGRYATVAAAKGPHGLFGEVRGDSVHLALLHGWIAADTARSVAGTIDRARGHIELSNGVARGTYTRLNAPQIHALRRPVSTDFRQRIMNEVSHVSTRSQPRE